MSAHRHGKNCNKQIKLEGKKLGEIKIKQIKSDSRAEIEANKLIILLGGDCTGVERPVTFHRRDVCV